MNSKKAICIGLEYLFPPRNEEFIPQIHLAGRFGSDGVSARVCARQRILSGVKFKWAPGSTRKPLPNDLQNLLDGMVAARLAWRAEHEIEGNAEKLRKEVLNGDPMLILREFVCNAFDAHARANRPGRIGLRVYSRPNGNLIMDVSDDGIGIKSVRQGPGFLEVFPHAVSRNWIPFVEGEAGIGLLWSKFLTELHGGSLEFMQDVYPGQKTTVRVSFREGVVKTSVS